MQKAVFEEFRRLVYEKSGISLGEQKEALLTSRLSRRMRELQIQDYRDYLRVVREDESGEEIVRLLDDISTNVTSFFREPEHFDLLRQAMTQWIDEGQDRFRIWSAAASTGEEPYSIAMTALDAAVGKHLDLKVLATDLSTRVLRFGMQALYDAHRMESVPPHFQRAYFEKVMEEGGEERFRVRSALREHIVFERINLSATPFVMHGPFDVVFCRNVMIYFDDTVRANLLGEIYRLLRPGGLLMVGHSESLAVHLTRFKTLRPSVYIKSEARVLEVTP